MTVQLVSLWIEYEGKEEEPAGFLARTKEQ